MAGEIPRVPRRLGPDSVVGVVCEKQVTGSGPVRDADVGARIAVDFRVDRVDGPPLPVSLRGAVPTGHVAEGDVVELAGRVRHGTLLAHELFNHTTGTLVQPSDRRARVAVAVLMVLLVAAVVVVVLAA